MIDPREARHFLFVPGNRPDRFDKAIASGADAVILDLEDAVPVDEKAAARQAVVAWLDAGGRAMVRINASDSPHFADDLALTRHPNLTALMLPKAAGGETLARIAQGVPVVALVETASGVSSLDMIARCPGVIRIALGTIDLALDLDLPADDRAFDPIRLQCTIASRAAGIAAPIDGVTPDFRNDAASDAAMRQARALGFRAKMCIHPRQIAPVEAALRPSDAEIERARRIVNADRLSGGAAVALDGAMIDRPIVLRAQRLLAELERISPVPA